MNKLLLALIVGTAFLRVSHAQECSKLWEYSFDTDPLHSKFYLGDTSAGYAVLSFVADPNIRLVVKGQFPHARFISLETQDTKLSINEDAIFDYQIIPDEGSINPFLEGNALNTANRNYTVIATQDVVKGSPNAIRLPSKGKSQSIMYRIYSPNSGYKLSVADLPKVYAYDKNTLKEVSCPRHASYPEQFHFPQFLADIYTTVNPTFEFKLPPEMHAAGLNKAASYMYAVSKLASNETMLLRFKTPTFTNTRNGQGNFHSSEEVRYWSFCNVNFPNNQTHNCLPDYLALPKEDGFQYIAVGKGDDVKREAERRGYSFLPDTRKSNQNVMGFVYRNILPKKDFKESQMYKNQYIPEALKCSKADFVANRCGW